MQTRTILTTARINAQMTLELFNRKLNINAKPLLAPGRNRAYTMDGVPLYWSVD